MTERTDNYRTVRMGNVYVTVEASKILNKLWSLRRLDLPACWIFEGDDIDVHYATCESLLDYLEVFGGKLIRLGANGGFVDRKLRGIGISSGRFLIQLD